MAAGLPCTGKTDLFFGWAGERNVAKAICGTCTEREPCAAGALARREPDGVWGGIDFGRAAELRVARAARRADMAGSAA